MNKVTITSPVASVRFPNLLEYASFSGVKGDKYTIGLMFDKKHKKELEDAITKAGGGKGKSPLKLRGDDEQYDPGMLSILAKSKFMVKAIDTKGSEVPLDSVTHGSEVQVKLTFERYEQNGGGVTTYMGNIRLLSSGRSGDMDFGDLPEGYEPGSDEELNDDLPF